MTVTETLPGRPRAPLWIDAAVLLCVAGLGFSAMEVAVEWEQPLRPSVAIDLSPAALPRYALYSLARGWIAYFFSLGFTLLVASWAYYDTRARRFILPALDVLQSVPVLGFLPGLVLALVGLFPHSNAGLEIACVLMIFTGQVWNGLPGSRRRGHYRGLTRPATSPRTGRRISRRNRPAARPANSMLAAREALFVVPSPTALWLTRCLFP